MRIGVVALLSLAVVLAVACGRAPQREALPAGSVVLAFGDSVTYGTGAGEGEDYPSRLAAVSGWDVRNHGVPGDTTAGALERIDAALEETAPALAIVEIGGNDFLHRLPEAAAKENIRRILRRIRQADVPAVLVATPRLSLLGAAVGMLPDADLYAELAEEEQVLLVPDVFARVLGEPGLKSDQIHPNAAGYARLAEGIAAALAEAGWLERR